jgi:hypothetical protein
MTRTVARAIFFKLSLDNRALNEVLEIFETSV